MAVLIALAAEVLVPSSALDRICADVHAQARKEFPKVTGEQLAIGFGEIHRAKGEINYGNMQGDRAYYPASTVKLFYLAYGAHLLDAKKLSMTPELERGFRDMIVDSTNDATALILDAVTGTTGGPELPARQLQDWMNKRNAVNRWLNGLGFKGINANQKTWNEGPYGRERQGYGPNFEHRNSLTARSGVHMMGLIALGKIATQSRNEWMNSLLSRKIPADSKDADYQSRAFIGAALPSGSKLWSKAGYTSNSRLDIAWVQVPSGEEYVLSIFTKDQSNEPKLIPFVAESLLKAVSKPVRTEWRTDEIEPES